MYRVTTRRGAKLRKHGFLWSNYLNKVWHKCPSFEHLRYSLHSISWHLRAECVSIVLMFPQTFLCLHFEWQFEMFPCNKRPIQQPTKNWHFHDKRLNVAFESHLYYRFITSLCILHLIDTFLLLRLDTLSIEKYYTLHEKCIVLAKIIYIYIS